MAESVIVRQNRNYELEVLAIDPHDPEATKFEPVDVIYQMTPYTMLLVSAATCTAIVVHTYAEYHAVPLEVVELQVTYDRIFQKDCEQCEALDEFEEVIDMHIAFSGQLSPSDASTAWICRHPTHARRCARVGVPAFHWR